MTDLQRRMHETVCLPAKLSACLCGAYARVAEQEVAEWRSKAIGAERAFEAAGVIAVREKARADDLARRLDTLAQGMAGFNDSIQQGEASWRDLDAAHDERHRLVWRALEESVRLQSHYAELLNTYDGGQRIGFTDAHDWLKRLAMSTEERKADAKRRAALAPDSAPEGT